MPPLRTCNKPGAMPVHPEVSRPDELPAGVPAPTGPAPARDAAGRVLPGAGARLLGARGG